MPTEASVKVEHALTQLLGTDRVVTRPGCVAKLPPHEPVEIMRRHVPPNGGGIALGQLLAGTSGKR